MQTANLIAMKDVKDLTLKVNGKPIGLKLFVKRFIGSTVFGMINSLRIKNMEIQKISLEIEYREESE